jgi:hypothetical protein
VRPQRVGARRRIAYRWLRAGWIRRVVGAHPSEQIDAVDQLHREEPLGVEADELAEGAQVGMLQILQRAKLVLETQDRLGRERAQALERHQNTALAVVGFVDHAHAAFADAPAHLEAAVGAQIQLTDRRHARSL